MRRSYCARCGPASGSCPRLRKGRAILFLAINLKQEVARCWTPRKSPPAATFFPRPSWGPPQAPDGVVCENFPGQGSDGGALGPRLRRALGRGSIRGWLCVSLSAYGPVKQGPYPRLWPPSTWPCKALGRRRCRHPRGGGRAENPGSALGLPMGDSSSGGEVRPPFLLRPAPPVAPAALHGAWRALRTLSPLLDCSPPRCSSLPRPVLSWTGLRRPMGPMGSAHIPWSCPTARLATRRRSPDLSPSFDRSWAGGPCAPPRIPGSGRCGIPRFSGRQLPIASAKPARASIMPPDRARVFRRADDGPSVSERCTAGRRRSSAHLRLSEPVC